MDTTSFTYDAGWEYDVLVASGSVTPGVLSVRLNTDSAPMSPTDPFGTYTEPSPSINYVPVNPFWDFAIGSGSSTASTTSAAFGLVVPILSHETVTLYGWWLQDDDREYLLMGGSFAAPVTLVPGIFQEVDIVPIQFTRGQCSTSPPPPTTLLLDTFQGSDTPLGDHSMDLGPGWSQIAGSASAGLGSCTLGDGTTACTALVVSPARYGTANLTFNLATGALPRPTILFAGDDSLNFSWVQVAPYLGTAYCVAGNCVAGSVSTVDVRTNLSIADGDHTITVTFSVAGAVAYLDGQFCEGLESVLISSTGSLWGMGSGIGAYGNNNASTITTWSLSNDTTH